MDEIRRVREPSISDATFVALETNFDELLEDLMRDHRLDKFRLECEKLHKSLTKSHYSEIRLAQKCRELNAEIVANAAKVKMSLKLTDNDEVVIAKLKKEIQTEWKKVDEAQEREAKARDIISSLKADINKFTDLLEKGGGLTFNQRISLNKQLKIKEEVTAERDAWLAVVTGLREQLTEGASKIAKLEADTAKGEEQIQEIKKEMQEIRNEVQKETLRKERFQHELEQAKDNLYSKGDEITAMQEQIQNYEFDIAKLEQNIKDRNVYKVRFSQDIESAHEKYIKLKDECAEQSLSADTLAAENRAKNLELTTQTEELDAMKAEVQKLNKTKEVILKRTRSAEDSLLDIEQQKENLKNQALALERHLEVTKKQAEVDKRNIEDLVRERDMLTKNVQKAATSTQKQLHLVKLHEQSKSKMQKEINKYRVETEKQRKIIFQLEKERDRYIAESSELTQRVLVHMEEVKDREMLVFNFKKMIAESETKMRQQQNLYDAVSSDRSLYSKNLLETHEEIAAMKSKLTTMNFSIEQLKDEIHQKEMSLVKEYIQFKRVEKEKHAIKSELIMMKERSAEMLSYIEAQEAEENKLIKIITEADVEKVRQTKELHQVIIERDILGTQLVRRNDELTVLYEEIKTKQSILNKGEVQYNQRLEDIRLLKQEIKKLRSENVVLRKRLANGEDVRREVYRVRQRLLFKRTRCKALTEELENPINIHRWRKLAGSNSPSYDMIVTIHALQKRLIQKTEEVEDKELLIQEKEKLYMELKNILARQPGPEVAEQLQIYQGILNDKNKQLKSLELELERYNTQVHDNKMDLKKIQTKLQNLRTAYFEQRKKEIKIREHNKILEKSGVASI